MRPICALLAGIGNVGLNNWCAKDPVTKVKVLSDVIVSMKVKKSANRIGDILLCSAYEGLYSIPLV